MTKKIITVLLVLMMLYMTACGENGSSDTDKAEETVVTTISERADDSSDIEDTTSATTTTTTEVTTTTTAETTSKKSTTTSVSTTAEQTTTTKAAMQATFKPVQTTTKVPHKQIVSNTTTTTAKSKATTTTTAAKSVFDIEAYRKQTIAEINKLFPEAQLDRSLYDRFERLCRGIETTEDVYQLKEQLCNFALRKYSGKTGTIEYIRDIYGENDSIITRSAVTAAKPIDITVDRTLDELDAHQNNGSMTNLAYFTTYEKWMGDYQKFVQRNFKGVRSFIKDCYAMMSSGIASLVKRHDNQNPKIDYKHKFYVFISPGYLNYSTGTKEHYLWFCEG